MVPYVDEVVAVTVVRVLLHVCLLRECSGVRYVGGTHSSCIVSSAADVLWMSVVRGI